MKFVVDASVAVKFYLPEVFEAEAGRLLEGGHQFHVPDLIYAEFTNVIWKKVRRNELDTAEGLKIISAFLNMNAVAHPTHDLVLSGITGATETGQTVYDWIYLALAISLDCRLVTADDRFLQAIRSTAFAENILWIGNT